MKIKSSSKVRSYTLKILSLVSVLALTLCLLVIPASAVDDSSSNSSIIKAGTYRWNDELTDPTSFVGNNQVYDASILFNCVIDGTEVSCNTIRLVGGSYYGMSLIDSNGDVYGVYASASGWLKTIGNVVFTEYTELDDTFATWFIENTHMLIKAGTYRWNDELTFDLGGEVSNAVYGLFPFVSNSSSYDALICEGSNQSDGLYFYLAYATQDETLFSVAFTNKAKDGYSAGWQSDTLKTITITEDQYAPTTFAYWSNENWEPASTDPDTCPTLNDYLNEFNDTTINGLPYTEGEAFLDYLIENDIDLYDSLWEALVGNLSIDELRLGNPELYEELYRYAFDVGDDAGYERGYNQAADDFSDTYVGDVVGGVFDALDRFTLFGEYSLLDLIKTIVGIFAVVWLLKLLAGG